jgi:hypothetical protein
MEVLVLHIPQSGSKYHVQEVWQPRQATGGSDFLHIGGRVARKNKRLSRGNRIDPINRTIEELVDLSLAKPEPSPW